MDGLMTPQQLRLGGFLERAERYFAANRVVTRSASGVHATSWGEVAQRARRIASALSRLGLDPFDRVATLAWNTHRHVELYHAIPGAGFVLHTLNLRLHPPQVAWVARHAEARVVFVDDSLLPLAEQIAPELPGVRLWVVLCDGALPKTSLAPVVAYESLVASGDPGFEMRPGPETEAALLTYTSGTTGNPKGVLYSHRALVMSSLLMATADGFGVGERDSLLVAVPLFHAAGWSMPYLGAMTGARLVLPSRNLEPAAIVEAIDAEGVTFSAGVPALWARVADLAESQGRSLRPLERVICAGAAVPPALIARYEKLGVEMLQAWGMTEIPPGTISRVRPHQKSAPASERAAIIGKQGLPFPTVDVRIVDDAGREAPADGSTRGELEIRALHAAGGYFRQDDAGAVHDGWLRTGDLASLAPTGELVIRDRTKDVIKSGGEWISSVELESLLAAHPAVLEVAVIGRPDPKWDERPLACVVLRSDASAAPAELREFLAARVARFWLPDAWCFLTEVPKTSVGKLDKKLLRERLARGELALAESTQ
jgi:fatty-acyl-CoA synthase